LHLDYKDRVIYLRIVRNFKHKKDAEYFLGTRRPFYAGYRSRQDRWMKPMTLVLDSCKIDAPRPEKLWMNDNKAKARYMFQARWPSSDTQNTYTEE